MPSYRVGFTIEAADAREAQHEAAEAMRAVKKALDMPHIAAAMAVEMCEWDNVLDGWKQGAR